ncbi:DgyrCDS2286 [Dimorphilus gyrociliatus]|uniref:DgyrCDS2286 n=1 Tax=Dimorphilus gyrociliatus TaxID=2664684 RepID=A0A7I8VEY0_9ANNE|nr:DgyrCDS2286 [Dimorphilus gyrociliatus]
MKTKNLVAQEDRRGALEAIVRRGKTKGTLVRAVEADDMIEKAELTLQKALFTAKATDEDFSMNKSLPTAIGPSFSLSALDNDERFKILESVELGGFHQSAFVGSRKKKPKHDFHETVSHEKAIFGNTFDVGSSSVQTVSEIEEEFGIRWNRWLDVLKKLRRREGF